MKRSGFLDAFEMMGNRKVMTMNDLIHFEFEAAQVRVIDRSGEPWFVLADVCRVLDIINPTQAAARLDDDERAMFNIGRRGNANVINESGLWNLVIRSDKPNARRFRKWVTSEVIPTIRRTGGYHLKELTRIEILTMALEAEKRALALEGEVGELKPDAESMRMLRSADGSITMTAMAKMLEVKRPWLFDLLTECGWFYTQNGAHLPYAPIMKQGFLTVDPGKGKAIMRSGGAVEVKVTTLVTAKGIAKITEIVKARLAEDGQERS